MFEYTFSLNRENVYVLLFSETRLATLTEYKVVKLKQLLKRGSLNPKYNFKFLFLQSLLLWLCVETFLAYT